MNEVSSHQLEELENLSQLKDDFLSTISHELRSPMTNIKMATQMLKLLFQRDGYREMVDDSSSDFFQSSQSIAMSGNGHIDTQSLAMQQEQAIFKARANCYLQILEQECDREMNLLNSFLDLQQLDAGNYCLSQTAIFLQELVPQTIKPFLQRIANQQLTFQLQIAANLPIFIIDQACLNRILTELLTNACKFTPPGGAITVMVGCEESTSAQFATILQLRVVNAGVEIPVREHARIFERFYRIPNGDRWRCNGTGLGLTLVKKLVECIGGSILVESGAGQTCFTVEIPV